MKQFASILPVALMLFIMSCNNQPKPAEEKPVVVDTVAKVAPPAFTPYKASMSTFTVKDFDKWYAVYAANDTMRASHGVIASSPGRGTDNDKWVIVLNEVKDIQQAKDFAVSPARKAAMKKGGVASTPKQTYYDVLRDDTSHIAQHERIMVTHHVKDFDAWLKVYDAEGKDARAANGMVDRWLARSVDDPNTVTLLFAITDLAKAKARIAAPEMKKLMTDAGVDGPPTITYFKWLNN